MKVCICHIRTFLILGIVLAGTTVFSQETRDINYNQPPNSSYLAEYGLSADIFNVLISPMYQEDYQFKAKMSLSELRGDEKTSAEYELVYDPFYEYGLTMKLIVHDPAVYDLTKKSSLKKYVGKSNEKYKKIRNKDVVSDDEVGLIKNDGEEVILGFQLKKSNLPNYLKYLSHMDGEVHIIKGELQQIVLSLNKAVKLKGIKATEGSLLVEFQRMESGGYLFKYFEESYKGTKKDEPVEISEILKLADYYDREGQALTAFSSDTEMAQSSKFPPDKLKVKLERNLPLLSNAARRAGYQLPLPYGVELFTHFQKEELGLECHCHGRPQSPSANHSGDRLPFLEKAIAVQFSLPAPVYWCGK